MYPLDKGGHRQYVVARLRSVSNSGHRKQEPGNGIRLNEGGVGRGDRVASPDGARVLRMLPGGADLAAVRWVGIDTEKVGGDLLPINAVEQRGLGCEEHKLEAIVCGQADVVLGADGVTLEKRLVIRQIHLKIERHGWRCDLARVARLRQRDRECRGETDSARWHNAGFCRHDPSPFEDLAARRCASAVNRSRGDLGRNGMLSADRLGLLHSSVSWPSWPSITPLPN